MREEGTLGTQVKQAEDATYHLRVATWQIRPVSIHSGALGRVTHTVSLPLPALLCMDLAAQLQCLAP